MKYIQIIYKNILFRNNNKKIQYFPVVILVFQDFTNTILLEQKKYEEQYHKLLLFSLSHEFRTPLNGIVGILDFLKKKLKGNNPLLECLKRAKHNCKSLSFQINDTLDYSQILTNCFKSHTEPILVRPFVSNLLKYALHQQNPNSEVKLVADISENSPPLINSDAQRLRQIIINLLTNAVNHTVRGHITLSAKLLKETDELEFAVEDTGCGMPESQVQNLFSLRMDSVQLVDSSFGTAGLGLTVAQMICVKLNSRLKVKSEINRGSRFSFALPMCDIFSMEDDAERSVCRVRQMHENMEEMKQRFIKQNKSSSILLGLKKVRDSSTILIVDDNDLNRFVLKEMVQKFEVKIRIAENGIQAVAEFEDEIEQNPLAKVLIFMDLNMPLMDGIQATAKIRRMVSKVRPRVVAVTAFASEEERSRCVAVGFDEFLSKPITAKKISEQVTMFFTEI